MYNYFVSVLLLYMFRYDRTRKSYTLSRVYHVEYVLLFGCLCCIIIRFYFVVVAPITSDANTTRMFDGCVL